MKRIIIETSHRLYVDDNDFRGRQSFPVIGEEIVQRKQGAYKWMQLNDDSRQKKQDFLILEEIPERYPRDYLLTRDTGYDMESMLFEKSPLSMEALQKIIMPAWDNGTKTEIFFFNESYQIFDTFRFEFNGLKHWRFIWTLGKEECLILDLIIGGSPKFRVSKGVFLFEGDLTFEN